MPVLPTVKALRVAPLLLPQDSGLDRSADVRTCDRASVHWTYVSDLDSDVRQGSCEREDYRLLFQLLREFDRGGDLGHRVFTAVRWFNRANSRHREQAESFICLSVALETLLRVPHDAKKNRFVDAIALLLGRVPRLGDWATQFYAARSRAVHEGNVGQVDFIPPATLSNEREAITYQSLLAYGREIFQLCLGTVLTGASLSLRADLAAKLITNSERFKTICRTLNDDSLPLAERLEQFDQLARDLDGLVPTRFFCEEGEPVHVENKTYVLSNQWGGDALDTAKSLAKMFPNLNINYEQTM